MENNVDILFDKLNSYFDDKYDNIVDTIDIEGISDIETISLSSAIYEVHNNLVNDYIPIAYAFSYECIYKSIAEATATGLFSAGFANGNSPLTNPPDNSIEDMLIDMILSMTGLDKMIATIEALKKTIVTTIINPIFELLKMFFSSSGICSTKGSIEEYEDVIFAYMRDMELYHYKYTGKVSSDDRIDKMIWTADTKISADDLMKIDVNAKTKTAKIIKEVNGFQFMGELDFIMQLLNIPLLNIVKYLIKNVIGSVFMKVFAMANAILSMIMSKFAPKLLEWCRWYMSEDFNHKIKYEILQTESQMTTKEFAANEEKELLTIGDDVLDHIENQIAGRERLQKNLFTIRDKCYAATKARLMSGIDSSFDAISMPLTVFVLEAIFNPKMLAKIPLEMLRKIGTMIGGAFSAIGSLIDSSSTDSVLPRKSNGYASSSYERCC